MCLRLARNAAQKLKVVAKEKPRRPSQHRNLDLISINNYDLTKKRSTTLGGPKADPGIYSNSNQNFENKLGEVDVSQVS